MIGGAFLSRARLLLRRGHPSKCLMPVTALTAHPPLSTFLSTSLSTSSSAAAGDDAEGSGGEAGSSLGGIESVRAARLDKVAAI